MTRDHGRARRWTIRGVMLGCAVSGALAGAGAGWRQATTRRAMAAGALVREQALRRTRDEAAARQARERDRAAAARAFELAGLLVDQVGLVRQRVPLGAGDRAAHGRARMALSEARSLFAGGFYTAAFARATEARDLAAGVSVAAADLVRRYDDAALLAEWRRWIEDAVTTSRQTGRAAIVVSKAAHLVTVYQRGRATRVYRGDLGMNWVRDKTHAGDAATPEGRYRVLDIWHRGSTFYKALPIDYPNALDQRVFAAARREGRLTGVAGIGGAIAIHGQGGRGEDWTDGCVALSNDDLDDLIARVEPGTPVIIVGASAPGEMAERLAAGRPRPAPARRPGAHAYAP